MTTGLLVNGVDVASIFAAKGPHTANATGWKSNGTDLNATLLALADGNEIGYNTGAESNGADFRTIFGVSPGSLPIQGQTFTSDPTFAGGVSTAILDFVTNNSGWSVSGSYSDTSGSVPSGATKCQVTVTYVSGNTGTSITNPLSSMTALTSTNETVQFHLSSAQSSPINATYTITIVYQNSAGSTISTTTCTFFMDTAAS